MLCASSLARAQLVESVLDSEKAKEEGLPFRGSTFSFAQTLSSDSLLKNEYQSYNPTYSWGFALNLIWHFNRLLSVRLNQELEIELTDSDSTTDNRMPMLSDTIGTFDVKVVDQKVSSNFEWVLHSSVGLAAPTSLASQAATMVLGTRLGVAGGLTWPKVMSGLGLNLTAGYNHRFTTSNVPQAEYEYPCSAGNASMGLCSQMGTSSNIRNAITLAAESELRLNDDWGVSLGFTHVWKRGADLADYSGMSADGTPIDLPDTSTTHWRNSSTLEIGVGYLLVPWLSLGLVATNTFKDRGINAELRAPFNMVDTYFGLNVGLRLDELYLAASGKGSSDDDE